MDPAGLATFGGTYAAAGGTITGPGYVFNGTLSITASPASPITILVAGNTALATNVLPNNVVWVQGNNTLGLNTSATLTPATGLVNHGTILLQSINGSGYTDTLACGTSGFTNGTDGTIQVVAGSGGSRVISNNFTNLGTVTVGASTALMVNSNASAAVTFTNQGQVTVDPAGSASFGGTYAAAGGNVTGPGYVVNGTLNVTASPATPATIGVVGATTLATDVLPNNTIKILALTTNAILSPATFGLVNHGTILLQSINGSGYTDSLACGTVGFTNGADGTIQTVAGSGSAPLITGSLTNLGAVSVSAASTLTVNSGSPASATFTNQGLVTVDPAGLAAFGGTYAAAGGTITGPGYVLNGNLSITASRTTPTTILVAGLSNLVTNVLPNYTVWVQGFGNNAAFGPASVGLVNHGTILLESINGSNYTPSLACGTDGFTNGADGTVQVMDGSGAAATITGSFTNLGTVTVGASASVTIAGGGYAASIFTNQGQVTVDPAGSATLNSTYIAAGGTITGPGYVIDATLDITASPTTPSTILIAGATTLGTNVLPNYTIWVGGRNSYATLSAAGETNHGTILLQSISGSSDTDTLACGGGFTNGADGTIQVMAGSGGSRAYIGTLTNLGTVTVGSGTTFAPGGTGGTYTQNGGATVLASGTLNGTVSLNGGVLSGTGTVIGSVTNAAAVSPGTATAAGEITVSGTYTQAAGGSLNIKVGGRTTPGQDYDQLVVSGTPPGSGTAALAGTVNVSLLNGFTPQPGDRYQIINYASHSGDFATRTGFTLGGGNVLVEQVNSTNLALAVDQPPAITSAGGTMFTAGTANSFTVTAIGTPGPTFTETGALPAGVTLSAAGVLSGTPAVGAVGTYSIVITPANAAGTGPSQNFTLTVTPATVVVSAPAGATAGTAITVTVTVQDAAQHTLTGYQGTLHFSSSDLLAVLPADAQLTNGTGSFNVTLKTAGNQTVTATDTMTGTVTGTATVAVSAAAATTFTLAAPAAATAGSAFTLTATARDAYGNVATGYTGTVHFTKIDTGVGAAVPADYTFVAGDNGAHTFTGGATLVTAGNQTVTVTDTAAPARTGSATVAVSAAAADHLVFLQQPTNTAAGAAIAPAVSVLVVDAYNNPVASTTAVTVAASGPGSFTAASTTTMPAVAGTATFSNLHLGAAGGYTLGATAVGLTAAFSQGFTVTATAANHFVVGAPVGATTGNPVSVTVTALDPYNNLAAGYGGTVHFTSSDPAAELPADATLTAGTGTFSVTFNRSGSQTVTVTATGAVTGTSGAVAVRGLVVTGLVPTATGFRVTFSKPFNLSEINLYDAASAGYGAADVTLAAPSGSRVRGSLVFDANDAGFTFVKTSGPVNGGTAGLLAAGTYTVTLASNATAFKDLTGAALDGNNDGVNGDAYTTTFTVAASAAVAVTVPDFARGPDATDAINVPNNSTNGLPVALSDGAGVTDATLVLNYDADLLTITGGTVNSALTGASFTVTTSGSGAGAQATIVFHSPTALAAGAVRLGGLIATVPANAPYKAKELLHWSSVSLNGGAITAVGDDAMQVVTFLGDTTGDGIYTSADSVLLSRVAVTADSGLAAYPILDPVIIGDLTGDGRVTAADTTALNLYISGTAVAQVPPYLGAPTNLPAGPDPTVSIPTGLKAAPGGVVTVPVNIDNPHPEGSTGLTQAVLALTYDPAVFDVAPADVHLGTVPAAGQGWALETHMDAARGEIGIVLYSVTPISAAQAGSLVTIDWLFRF